MDEDAKFRYQRSISKKRREIDEKDEEIRTLQQRVQSLEWALDQVGKIILKIDPVTGYYLPVNEMQAKKKLDIIINTALFEKKEETP